MNPSVPSIFPYFVLVRSLQSVASSTDSTTLEMLPSSPIFRWSLTRRLLTVFCLRKRFVEAFDGRSAARLSFLPPQSSFDHLLHFLMEHRHFRASLTQTALAAFNCFFAQSIKNIELAAFYYHGIFPGMIDRLILSNHLQQALIRSRVVALVGPRQCGKTTLAQTIVTPDSPNYFDLEDPISLARLDEPMTALRDLRGTVVIDEVQHR